MTSETVILESFLKDFSDKAFSPVLRVKSEACDGFILMETIQSIRRQGKDVIIVTQRDPTWTFSTDSIKHAKKMHAIWVSQWFVWLLRDTNVFADNEDILKPKNTSSSS